MAEALKQDGAATLTRTKLGTGRKRCGEGVRNWFRDHGALDERTAQEEKSGASKSERGQGTMRIGAATTVQGQSGVLRVWIFLEHSAPTDA